MYLDHEGLESLQGQVAGMRMMEYSETVSNSSNKTHRGIVGITGLGAKIEAGGEVASGKRYDIFERTAPRDERLLLNLESHLAAAEYLEQITCVRSIAEIYAKGTSEFVKKSYPCAVLL